MRYASDGSAALCFIAASARLRWTDASGADKHSAILRAVGADHEAKLAGVRIGRFSLAKFENLATSGVDVGSDKGERAKIPSPARSTAGICKPDTLSPGCS